MACIQLHMYVFKLSGSKILAITLLSIALIPNLNCDWEGGQLLLPGFGLVREPTPKVTLKIKHT